jgi:hypothetical protein
MVSVPDTDRITSKYCRGLVDEGRFQDSITTPLDTDADRLKLPGTTKGWLGTAETSGPRLPSPKALRAEIR